MKDRIIDDQFIGRIETMSVKMKSSMKGYFGGNHKTKTYGQTVEFADFREYNLGDDIRRIDWNLYSRFEKHFIKLFVDERQMHMQIFLDCSSSMFKVNNDKASYALKIAAALGYLSVNNMDKISYLLLRGNNTEDICGIVNGKSAYYKAIAQLEKTSFADEVNIGKAVLSYKDMGSCNGLSFLISDFLMEDDWKQAIDYMIYKKRDVVVIQVLSPEELDPLFNGRISILDTEATDVLDERNMKMRQCHKTRQKPHGMVSMLV